MSEERLAQLWRDFLEQTKHWKHNDYFYDFMEYLAGGVEEKSLPKSQSTKQSKGESDE